MATLTIMDAQSLDVGAAADEMGSPTWYQPRPVTLGFGSYAFRVGDVVRVGLDGPDGSRSYLARVTAGGMEEIDDPWRRRILNDCEPRPPVTAAVLRERGLREGWLR